MAYRYEVTNITKVRAAEDILDARCSAVEIVVPLRNEDVVLYMDARAARGLARFLNRHANFIDPAKRKRP